jgi:hypothetical protein
LGTVNDPSGAPVPGATTNGDGLFRFPVLPAGHYSLSIQTSGFKVYNEQGIELSSSVSGEELNSIAIKGATSWA